MRQELKEQLLKGVVTIILCTSVFCRKAGGCAGQRRNSAEDGTVLRGHRCRAWRRRSRKIGINGALEKK